MTLDPFHEEEELRGVYDRALVGWLLGYARPHWRALAGCVVLLLLLTVLELSQPYIISVAIDRVLAPAETAPGPGARSTLLSGLWPLVTLYLSAVVMAAAVAYAQALWLQTTGRRILTRIRRDAFAHLQTLSLPYFDSRPAGRIVTRVSNDVEALGEMYTSVLVNLFRDVFFVAGSAFMLVWLDARLALVALAALPIVLVTALVFRRFSRQAWRAMRARLARINATLAESLSGMSVIQAFGREAHASDEFRATNDAFYDASMRMIHVFAVFGPLLSMLTTLVLAAVLWSGGASVLAGTMTFGTLYAFTAYLNRLFGPINALAEKYNILQAALAAAERIVELLDTEPEVRDPPGPPVVLATPPANGDGQVPAVAFEDVWFAYRADDWVLRGVGFQVMPGETVAFVGQTGAGKSTIMNLLPRFYDVQRGAVRVYGTDVRQISQRALRRRVGIVMQDVFLFATDIAGNVTLGAPGITVADAARAAAVVGADAFIRRLPEGYDTPVVERGKSLSAGQRQLISFARALAYDPDILILDEATASVDSETEAALQQAIAALAARRTTIIVAHRLATVRHVDRIYVMRAGEIIEVGRHDALLAQGGVYRRLWELQFIDDNPPGEP